MRKCFYYTLPAIIIGSILRISLIAAIPESYYGADSNSYFDAARQLILQHRISFDAKRRFLYPFLLIFAPEVPNTNTPQVVSVVQHTSGVAVLFGIGWIVGNFVRRPKLWVPLVTIFAAVWPRTIWYEHEIGAEPLLLATFVLAVALAVPVERLKESRRLFWFLLASAIMMSVKPHARPIWLALMATACLFAGRPWKWEPRAWFAVALGILFILTAGSGPQGSWLFLTSSLPLVKTEGTKWAQYRAILRPYVEKANADLPNYAFHERPYKKMLDDDRPDAPLGPIWTELVRNKKKFSTVAKSLAIQGVLSHPWEYTHLVLRKNFAALSEDSNEIDQMIPSTFWKNQEIITTKRWNYRPEELELLYRKDRTAYEKMVNERKQRTLWYGNALIWYDAHVKFCNMTPGKPGESPATRPTVLGWLALLGIASCFISIRRAKETFILWMSLIFYGMTVYAVGDALPRYLYPTDWILFVMVALGLDAAITLIGSLSRRLRRSHSIA